MCGAVIAGTPHAEHGDGARRRYRERAFRAGLAWWRKGPTRGRHGVVARRLASLCDGRSVISQTVATGWLPNLPTSAVGERSRACHWCRASTCASRPVATRSASPHLRWSPRGPVVEREAADMRWFVHRRFGIDPRACRQQRMGAVSWPRRARPTDANRALTDVEAGSYLVLERLTVRQWLEDEWLPSRRPGAATARGHRGTVAPSTWEQYRTYVRAWIVYLGHVALLAAHTSRSRSALRPSGGTGQAPGAVCDRRHHLP